MFRGCMFPAFQHPIDMDYKCNLNKNELIPKRFSLVKLKADRKFQPQEYLGISRIEIADQRRDWSKWGVLKLAQISMIELP